MIITFPIGGYGNHLRLLILVSILPKISKQFVFEKIYPETRSWHNWLKYEWRYREFLDRKIESHHNMIEIKDDEKVLAIICDPIMCYQHYVKMNSSLCNAGIKDFIEGVQDFNKHYESIKDKTNLKLIYNTSLSKESLDPDFYKSLLDFFDITQNNYSLAAEIHSRWHVINKAAESDFYEHVKLLYKSKANANNLRKLHRYIDNTNDGPLAQSVRAPDS